MRRTTRILPTLTLLACLVQAGCAAPGAGLPRLPEQTDSAYTLNTGDQVRLITFADEQLTGEFRVNDAGNVALPLVGPVRAAGLTTVQLGNAVAEELRRRKLFRDPSVSVEVTSYRPFFILGEVNKPGQYPYQPGMTVLAAVTVGGGFTYRAVENTVSVVRHVGDHAVEYRGTRQSLISPGDVVTVFERRF